MEIIQDILQWFTQSNIGKCTLLGAAAVAVGTGFVFSNLNGQNAICHEAGFGDYNDEKGICMVDGNYASNLIIVAGNTANSPKPQFQKHSVAYDYLKNSIANYANIKVVSAASDLSVKNIEIGRNETNDAEGYIKSINNAIDEVNNKIGETPKSNGATYYEAISKAGRDAMSSKTMALNSKNNNDEGSAIIVLGSGLSDGGILNFADYNLLSQKADDITTAMEKADQLKNNLSGLRTIWSGLGQTMAPQEKLSDADIENLKNIYSTVFNKRGINIIFDETIIPSETIENNKYTVKPTPLSNSCLPFIELSDEQLSFKADSAELTDTVAARNALAKVISSAGTCPDKKIVVTGYMAAGNCSGKPNNPTLSGLRAETVKSFLQSHGVLNTIETVNGGVFDPGKSECENGVLKPELMNYRRKVTIEFK